MVAGARPCAAGPTMVAAEPLGAEEEAVVALFERNTRGVVNVIDVNVVGGLPGGLGGSGGMEVPEGNGTGCVWDAEGHVVTNYHVVARAAGQAKGARLKVRVLDEDGVSREYEGRIVGTDRAKDLAVLQVLGAPPKGGFAPLTLGARGAPLRVGQKVYAIGNPFGFDHTLTTGVVSGLDREIMSRADGGIIRGGIQTDASINPGNSGGALLDSAGRLVGVNTAIYTPTGVSAGVGFALPIDLVAKAVPRILAAGGGADVGQQRLAGGLAGVEFARAKVAQALLPDVAPVPGPMVLSVQPGSVADKAGLRPVKRGFSGLEPGDVIVAVCGVQVADADALADALDDADPAAPITLDLLGGRTLTLPRE